MLSTATSHDTATSFWPPLKLARGKLETHRAFPHAFIRSSLFSSRKFSGEAVRDVAAEDNPIIIRTLSNYELVQVAGERLDQGDCDVYMWLLNRAYQRGLAGKPEARIFFTREEAISERGRSRGTKMFRLFHESLMRLYKADIIYKTPYANGRTRLISSIEEPTPTNKKKYDYEVIISAKVGDFFHENDFRILKNEERAKLKDYLSKWLHAFYSSHRNPIKYKCDLIKRLTDRGDTPERIWREKLQSALANVKEATGWLACEVMQEDGEPPKIHVIKGERQFPKKDAGESRIDGGESES
ncbi:plasmid replication initiator TrfA [Paraburkholderia sediminicola]|uniref:plasmid replication initiator TrfA n=1 Tax=Paraburkholderia sediminicola TaxID=458836 RepID=UPI0038BB00B3